MIILWNVYKGFYQVKSKYGLNQSPVLNLPNTCTNNCIFYVSLWVKFLHPQLNERSNSSCNILILIMSKISFYTLWLRLSSTDWHLQLALKCFIMILVNWFIDQPTNYCPLNPPKQLGKADIMAKISSKYCGINMKETQQ